MKNVLIAALLLSFTTVTSQAWAAKAKCSVVTTNTSSITLDCGSKAKTFKVGDEVRVETIKKKKVIEGC